MLVYGNKVNGTLNALHDKLNAGQDQITKPGDIFQFELHTQEGFDPALENDIVTQVLLLEKRFPDAQVLYVETCNKGKITVQVMDKGPGEISGIALLTALPYLLIAIGVIVGGYLAWQLLQSEPTWLLATVAAVGVGLVLFMLTYGRIGAPTGSIITGRKPKKSDKDPTSLRQLQSEAYSQYKTAADQLSALEHATANEQAEAAKANLKTQAGRDKAQRAANAAKIYEDQAKVLRPKVNTLLNEYKEASKKLTA